LVSSPITLDFFAPFRHQLVPPEREPPAVPKITIHEDRNHRFPENEVWTAWKITGMLFKRKPSGTQCLGEQTLRASITSPYASHQSASLGGAHDVTPVAARNRRITGSP
jgi:hypothetical protein